MLLSICIKYFMISNSPKHSLRLKLAKVESRLEFPSARSFHPSRMNRYVWEKTFIRSLNPKWLLNFLVLTRNPCDAPKHKNETENFWHWLVAYFSNASGEKIYIVSMAKMWEITVNKEKDLRALAKSSTDYIKCVLNCFAWEHQQLAWKAVSDVMFKKYWIMFAFQLSPHWLRVGANLPPPSCLVLVFRGEKTETHENAFESSRRVKLTHIKSSFLCWNCSFLTEKFYYICMMILGKPL